MKQTNFKDSQNWYHQNSSGFSSLSCENANSWQNNTNNRIEMLRKKYESPSFCKSIKQSELDQSGILRDSTNLNQSHVIKREFMKNSQQNFRQNTMKFDSIRQDSRYQSRNYMGDEEIVLNKIKQMKQSLLSDKNKNVMIRLNQQKERSSQVAKNYEIKSHIDNRADNIDRINSKIRHILSCLNQTQKDKNNQKEKIQRFDRSAIQPKSKYNNQNLTILRKSCENTHKYESSMKFKSQIDTNPITNKEISLKSDHFQKQDQQKQTKIIQKKQDKITYHHDQDYSQKKQFIQTKQMQMGQKKEQSSEFQRILKKNQNQRSLYRLGSARSKSNLGYNFNKRTYQESLEKDKKNSVKFDEQIQKIQTKIKKFEEQKKKLQIDFKPFQYEKPVRNSFDTNKLSSGYRLSEKTKYTDKKIQNDKPITPFNRSISSSCFNPNPDIEKSSGTKKTIGSYHIAQKINQYKAKTTFQDQNSHKQAEDTQLRKKTGEGIQDRKKKLNIVQNTQKNVTLKILVKCLSEQVQKDEELRNAKLWLQNNADFNKFTKLKEQLSKLNINMDINTIKSEFENTQQQNNPFFSVRESRQTYQSVARAFQKARQYWQKNIFERFSESQLQIDNFTVKKIDLERKGHIVVQDLVRLLNMETGKFFRNRDLILIFRRLSKTNRITFNDFMKIITKKP